jgi:multicomponent Na+:H+ antiporter subunit C
VNVVLAATAAMLFGTGTYLVLQRKLSRIIIGIGLMSHGANVLMLVAGTSGIEPIIGAGPLSDTADPLTQALALTTIVITFGTSALLLALAFRSWILTHDDEVENDVADMLVARGGPTGRDLADELQAESEFHDEQAHAAREGADVEG